MQIIRLVLFRILLIFIISANVHAATIEVGFSPAQGAEALVLKTIGSAQESIHILAYSFTSATVTKALIQAVKRGVSVSMVVDYKHNFLLDRSGKARAALQALSNAGALIRVNDNYAIHHDKVMVIDQRHVETGSFNFSYSAAARNSENVIVIRDDSALAAAYFSHWKRNWDGGKPMPANY